MHLPIQEAHGKKHQFKMGWLEARLNAELLGGSRTEVSLESFPEQSASPRQPFRDSASVEDTLLVEQEGAVISKEEDNGEPSSMAELLPLHSCPECARCSTEMSSPYFQTSSYAALVAHLQDVHRIRVQQPRSVRFVLDRYLSHYSRAALETYPLDSTKHSTATTTTECILGPAIPGDTELRQKLQLDQLSEILARQQQEREHDAKQPHPCIFCRTELPDRQTLFQHMSETHGMQMGLPDNLVDVNLLLRHLRSKLDRWQCLYCERVFKSGPVLRVHMRKKKHFKINPWNELYDRFYLVNYRDPDLDWKQAQPSSVFSSRESMRSRSNTHGTTTIDEDDEDTLFHQDPSSVEDWDSPEPQQSTPCLFCRHVSPTPEQLCQEHFPKAHSFQIDRDWQHLSFYEQVKLVNFIRRQTSQCICFQCEYAAESEDALEQHWRDTEHFRQLPPKECNVWSDPQYLLPIMEDDPLLQVLQDSDEELEDSRS